MDRIKFPVLLALVVAVLLLVAAAPAPRAQASPEQAPTCTWQNIGSNRKDLYHVGTAFDTDANKMYVYGGVDPQMVPQNSVEVADLSGTQLRANWTAVGAGTARDLVGPAGAYRAKGAGADASALYWFGGLSDTASGNAEQDVQRFLTKTSRWERVNPSNASEFRARFFASAAYDPVHDVIWVAGGVQNCALGDVVAGNSCNARPLPTQYLSFDATTGEPKWNTLSGGDLSIYGATMIYDAPRNRMILFGGTTNISQGRDDVRALDLSDPDPTKAKWATLATTGSGPSVFFHGGAFFTARNWLVVYGGNQRNFMQNNEQNAQGTFGLDLSKSPAVWTDLKPSGNPGTRVGGGMEYDPKHNAAVFVLGRDKFVAGDPLPAQKVQRTTYALTCTDAGPTPVTPTTPVTPGTPTTPTSPTPVTPTTPPPTVGPPPVNACTYLTGRVPAAVVSDAVANPAQVAGYNIPCNPNLPVSLFNPLRSQLALENPNLPYHPLFNTVIWKCGCP